MAQDSALNWKSVLIRLNRISREHPRNIAKLRRHLLLSPHELCSFAAQAAVEDGEPLATVLADVLRVVRDPTLARQMYEEIPKQTIALALAALEATKECLEDASRGKSDFDERGELLNNLSGRLAELGEHQDALRYASLAVEFYHKRSEADVASLPNLATAFRTLAVRQADCGQNDESLSTAKRAVALFVSLVTAEPHEHAFEMAKALMTLSLRHAAVGNPKDALKFGRRACRIFKLLVLADPRHLQEYALSVQNIGNQLYELGRKQRALKFSKKAVQFFLMLEARNPDSFKELTATALTTLAANLADCHQPQQALKSAEQAAVRLQDLHKLRPKRFLIDLIACLSNLSECQAESGFFAKALETAKETFRFAKELRMENGPSADSQLEVVLTNLARRHLAVKQFTQASKRAAESVRLCRTLARRRPESRPDLVYALFHLAEAYRGNKKSARALRTAREAVRLGRSIARENFVANGERLATAIQTLSSCEVAAGKTHLALRHQKEEIRIRQRLCEKDRAQHLVSLAVALKKLSILLWNAGRQTKAIQRLDESLAILTELSAKAPEIFGPELESTKQLAERLRAAKRKNAGTH